MAGRAAGHAAVADAFRLAAATGQEHREYKGNGINAPLDATLWRKFISAPDQVRTRVAFALSEIFVVNVASITASWPLFGAAGFMDLLAEHALGDYRSLLAAVSRNLSMGCMLTFRGSRRKTRAPAAIPTRTTRVRSCSCSASACCNCIPTARPPGRRRAGGNLYERRRPGPGRVFTGWDLDGPEADVEFHRRPMKLDPRCIRWRKSVSWASSFRPARAARSRWRWPWTRSRPINVGPFIGAQLIQRLVASNPSPAYVARVAAVFADDGLGARGNLKAVTRAVLLDPEARFPDLASPHWGKVREPILRFSGWARAFGARSSNGAWAMPTPATTPSGWRKARCARPACSTSSGRATRPPPPSWRARGLAAPELQITDETSIAGYLNFLAIYADRGWEDLQTDYAAELALAGDPDALVAHVALLLAGDAFSEATARRIATALRDIPPERPRDRVRAAIVLVAASPEYLVQK